MRWKARSISLCGVQGMCSPTFAKSPVEAHADVYGHGAMLSRSFRGAGTVAQNERHAVVRYAKPMMLGVSF
ncbi:MAG: hypothetical protein ACLUMK_13485 [Christensenellales bacterium]